MTTDWCRWCGESAEAERTTRVVRCERCVRESLRLFRFWPTSAMVPLGPGEQPGVPVGRRCRFVFTDTRTGEIVGETGAPSARGKRSAG